MGWLSGWNYRKKITIQNANVDSNLTDFPLYVDITSDGDIGTRISDSTNGYDIRFTDNGGVTLLKYERKYFNVTTSVATGHYWVKCNPLAASTTDIYIYYNDGDGTVDGEDAANVWDANFKAVWHMDDATTSSITDSSGNANSGTKKGANEPIEAVGKIYKAQDFDGDVGQDDYIDVGSGASIDDLFDSGGSVSFWAYTVGAGEGSEFILQKDKWGIRNSSDGQLDFKKNFSSDPWFGQWNNDGSEVTWGAWHHIVITYDSGATTNDPSIYVDGVSTGINESSTPVGTRVSDAAAILCIGSEFDYTDTYNGNLEEVRLYNGILSADWIKFEHANMNEGDNELTWEAEETSFIPKIIFIN